MYEYALAHHGIKGQRWGVRRYQNEDGTLTEEGRRYYGVQRQSFKQRRQEHTNVGDTGRRSAVASAKSTFKTQAKVGAVTSLGAAGAGIFLGAPPAAAAIIAGTNYVASLGGMTLGATLVGRAIGRSKAKQQNKAIEAQIVSGNRFVVSKLTSEATGFNVGPYYQIRTSTYSERPQ